MHPISARSAIPAILPNPASNGRADAAAQPQVSPGTIPTGVPGADKAADAASNVDRAPPVFPAQLSAGDLDALQSVDHSGDGKSASSPAHQARAFIADHPEFAGMPFGHVVSQFARGQTPLVDTSGDTTTPPVDTTDSGTPSDNSTQTGDVTPPVDGSIPPTNTASDVPPSDTSTSPVDTSADVPATDAPIDTASNPPTDTTSTDTPADVASSPSDPPPNVAVTDPDQALIDALT
jgi:hypothetical protein